MAGAGAIRPHDGRHSQPAWGVDPHRHHAVRSRPAVFALADHAIAETDLVHADGVGRSTVHASGRGRLVPAVRDGVGARRRGAVAAFRRRPYRGGHQAGLSRHPGAPRTHPADSGAGAGAGAVVNGNGLIDRCPCESRTHSPRCYLLISRIEIVARGGRRGHAFGTRAMGPAPPPRKTLAATALEFARAAIDLRLRPGDEGRQAIDADIIRDERLWLRLKLRLRTMFAMAGGLAGLLLVARLVGLPLALVVALIVVARHERLLLDRPETGLLAEMGKIFAPVVALLRGHFVLGARLRLVLTELFLGGGDQAAIMFGMLVVILGGYRIAGGGCVSHQLHGFFRDIGGGIT